MCLSAEAHREQVPGYLGTRKPIIEQQFEAAVTNDTTRNQNALSAANRTALPGDLHMNKQ